MQGVDDSSGFLEWPVRHRLVTRVRRVQVGDGLGSVEGEHPQPSELGIPIGRQREGLDRQEPNGVAGRVRARRCAQQHELVTAATEDEVWQLMELHAAVAHQEDPAAWDEETRAYLKTLIRTV